MTLLVDYLGARHDEDVARLRRMLALRAAVATGMSQREIATALGISQAAVSQQLKTASDLSSVHPGIVVEAAGPVLRRLAENAGYGRLAVFGSVARGEATGDSDIDLLVEAPEGTSSFEFIRFKRLLERVLGRQIDLVDYGGLKQRLDDDIRRDAVLL
ncbi:nucleotidyltransferase domain-containing protein [Nocardioides sp. LMS-CY]|uniref:nucleotidyltransferase domain-containing protein n=1 Tax=Nocardioides sp. (strain LMS-CY) TaxID=2840457 RepID=UPI001C005217|nr:nucleotidyltransferase domain-containing protein [Nocardioides sp. LMS-CY]QWF21012.1 nucleotidyltransferase domain-containing protein [Nocardioides sp. LMS-CY]